MKIGDMVFAYPTGFIGKAIARVTKSKFSHVALYIGNGYVIESDSFIKTRIIRLQDTAYGAIGKYEVMTCDALDHGKRAIVWAHAVSKLGTKYDYLLIPSIFIRLMTGMKTDWLDRPHRYICTELIYESYQLAGIELLPGHPGGSVSPEELRWSEHLEFSKEENAYGA